VFIKNNLIGGVRIHNAQQKTRIMKQELLNKIIGYQLKSIEYIRLIDQAKRENKEILVDVYTDLLNQCNRLINLCNNNL
jgi:hypothetical protein